jgi:acetyl esterase/lipase
MPDIFASFRRARQRAGLALAAILFASGAQAQMPFYAVTEAELAGPPGSVIRADPMIGPAMAAKAYRVLYRSKGLKNEPIAVSAMVIVPLAPPPAGGRPVIAWAHPTSGVVPHCAPSLALIRYQTIDGLREMIGRGYVVVATDYPGLGTAGPHPYLVGMSEARAVLDSVRAVRHLPELGAGNRFAVWGHSQGGHAALFAGMIARGYAPELNLVGVAAAAPATELGTLLNDDFNTAGGKSLTAMTLWSWTRVFGVPLENVIYPAALPAIDLLANQCIESIPDILLRAEFEKPLNHTFLKVKDITAIEPWRTLMRQNTPGLLPRNIPVFIAQGGEDKLVLPQVTKNYMRALCRNGSAVRFVYLPRANHGYIGMIADTSEELDLSGRVLGRGFGIRCCLCPWFIPRSTATGGR